MDNGGTEALMAEVPFRYRLGPFALHTVRRPMLLRKYGLRELLQPGGEVKPPASNMPPGAVGLAEKSKRVKVPFPVGRA